MWQPSLCTLHSNTNLKNNSEEIICNIHHHTYSEIRHKMIPGWQFNSFISDYCSHKNLGETEVPAFV